MSRRSLIPVAVATFALLATACAPSSGSSNSSGNFRGDQKAVATTVEDFEKAASSGDENKICRDVLAPALARRLTARGGSCTAAVNKAIKDADTFTLDVKTVRITGDQATARVSFDTGKKTRTGTITLTRAGSWRIADLTPTTPSR